MEAPRAPKPKVGWKPTPGRLERLRGAYAALEPSDRERVRGRAMREEKWILQVVEEER